MQYGLLGEKLSHSYSKEIHGALSDYDYELFELPKEDIPSFLRQKDFRGINVTIPYKKTVMPYLDVIDEKAIRIGAVNTIVNREGTLYGYNTDYDGFLYTLHQCDITVTNEKVLVLGNGGAAMAVFEVLRDLHAAAIIVVKQHKENGTCTYEEAARLHADCSLLINTSPVGMYPYTDASPIDLTPYEGLTAVVDIIYNPKNTKLMLQAMSRGIKAVGGLRMLIAQAYYASYHFTGHYPSHSIEDVLSRY